MMTLWVVASLLPAAGPSYDEFINGARMRRARREKMVQKIGPVARNFVETYGEHAVVALDACQVATGEKLVALFNSGDMKKWPRPADLLVVIAKPNHRDDIALFALECHRELEDLDAFEAYLADPLTIAMRLKPLAQAAAEMRAKRLQGLEVADAIAQALQQQAAKESKSIKLPDLTQINWKENQSFLLVVGGIILVIVLACGRRRSGPPGRP